MQTQSDTHTKGDCTVCKARYAKAANPTDSAAQAMDLPQSEKKSKRGATFSNRSRLIKTVIKQQSRVLIGAEAMLILWFAARIYRSIALQAQPIAVESIGVHGLP